MSDNAFRPVLGNVNIPLDAQIEEIESVRNREPISKEYVEAIDNLPMVDPIEPREESMKIAAPIITAANITTVKLPAFLKARTTKSKNTNVKVVSRKANKVANLEPSSINVDVEKLERSKAGKSSTANDIYSVQEIKKIISDLNIQYNAKIPKSGKKEVLINGILEFVKNR